MQLPMDPGASKHDEVLCQLADEAARTSPAAGVVGRALEDASPSESFSLLTGSDTAVARKSGSKLRSRISSWASAGSRRSRGESDAAVILEELCGAGGSAAVDDSAEAPSLAEVVAGCNFDPDLTQVVAPGDGVLIRCSPGERLQVLGHHPAGWVRVRALDAEDDLEGWIPAGACLASGEVGRRIAARDVSPPEGADERQLAVSEGALLKLLEQKGDAWWVEVDGCRGYVPESATREPRPGEEVGLSQLRSRLRQAALQSKSGLGKDAEKNSPWTFGLWAYMASFYAIALAIMVGGAGIAAFLRPAEQYPDRLKDFAVRGRHLYASVFSLACGLLWLVFNWKSKRAAQTTYYTPRGSPVRGLLISCLAAPMLASGVTFLAGVATSFVALLSFLSARRREKGSVPEGPSAPMQFLAVDEELQSRSRLSPAYWILWWELQGVRGQRPKIFLVLAWLVANVVLGTYKYRVTRFQLLHPTPELLEKVATQCWTGGLAAPGDEDCSVLLDLYQTWIPWAKFFGMTLNLNCALIILMVCQRFIGNVTEHAGRKGGVSNSIARKLPTHKNLIFHKGLAATIAVQAFIHTWAHYMAHSWTLPTLVRYGYNGKWVTLSIWATGALIVLCIVAMYPVSREFVKKTKFEAFIYTHAVCGTTFMLCLIWHGQVFYYWAAFPLGLYVLDRYTRWTVSSLAPGKLLQVRYRPPVLQLTFNSPWNYNAGQYVWLCCPSIKKYEKHPFTISSAPETGLLSLAIKCHPGGWTEKLRDFLAGLCEGCSKSSAGFTYSFEDRDWISGQKFRGLSQAPGGGPLLLIDGPHAAPAMRYLEFEVVILAAAGIGLTPASSVLRSLLQYRWRSDANAKPHSIYFCWLCACPEVPAFEWFADELSDSEVAAAANENLHGSRSEPPRNCELHLFITRAPKPDDPQARGPPEPQPAKIYGHLEQAAGQVQRPYTGPELLEWMKHPATKSDAMSTVLSVPRGERPNEAGHTCVWNGRPQWDALFKHVGDRHRSKDGGQVGVFFCGAPAIGKDLKRNCSTHSDKDLRFELMKESF